MFGGTIKLNPLGLVVVIFMAIGLLILFRWNNDRGSSSELLLKSAALNAAAVDETNGHLTMKRLLVESIVAAEKGGLQVVDVHSGAQLNAKRKGMTKEGADELVTDADFRSHKAIKASLLAAFKGHDINLVSEEHGDDMDELAAADIAVSPIFSNALEVTSLLPSGLTIDDSDVTIWIDPLDATKEFTEDLLQYVTVLVCVAIKSKPVIGVVHRPFKSETFWAWVGQGKSVNLRPHTPKDLQGMSNATKKIIVSRSHAGRVTDIAKKAFGENAQVISAGGAGYKVLQVILGEADVYVHTTLIKKWDICAGNALLNAVDGHMTTLDGRDIDYNYDRDSGVTTNQDGILAAVHGYKKYADAMRQL